MFHALVKIWVHVVFTTKDDLVIIPPNLRPSNFWRGKKVKKFCLTFIKIKTKIKQMFFNRGTAPFDR